MRKEYYLKDFVTNEEMRINEKTFKWLVRGLFPTDCYLGDNEIGIVNVFSSVERSYEVKECEIMEV